MKIGVSGASGLIGSALCRLLIGEGHQVTVFGRSRVEPSAFSEWDLFSGPPDRRLIKQLDAFVHLAGEPIAAGRWSSRRKRLIRDSRVVGTRNLIKALSSGGPRILVNASAVGLYGSRGSEILDETSAAGEGFLPGVCQEWEAEAERARQQGIRVVLLRTGIVLSLRGGVLNRVLTPFKMGLGGRIGSGRQYMSWIHIDDEVRLILFSLEHEALDGPLNATAPNPVSNAEFTSQLGDVCRRPTLLPVPASLLRLAVGEMADRLLLEGQRVIPRRAAEAGFSFSYPELKPALEDLLQSGR